MTFGACLAAILTLAWPIAAHAGLTATIIDPADSDSFIAVMPGATFNVKVRLTTDTSLVSGQLNVTDTTSSGFFTLNSVSFYDPLWSTSSGDVLDPTPEALVVGNSYTSGDIGTLADDLVNGTGTGTYDFFTMSVTIGGGAQVGSDYDLNLVNMVFGDTNFDEVTSVAGPDFVVHVVPAPAAAVLGAVGLGVVHWLRRRWEKA